jgi:hypothetical protein
MTKFYLRIEGVNLGNFLDDTSKLNTIRGSGLLLLSAIRELRVKFANLIDPISVGASVGLFELKPGVSPDELLPKIRTFLNEGLYMYATFVASIVEDINEDDDHFVKAKEMVLAKNRFQQMRSPSLSVPGVNQDEGISVCELTNLRPAEKEKNYSLDPDGKYFSKSALDRWEFGKLQKKKEFYKEFAGFDGKFTNSFKEITDDDVDGEVTNSLEEMAVDLSRSRHGNLNRKMAVIYFDGNKFGNIQKRLCKDDISQRKFDKCVQDYRRDLLVGQLNKMDSDDEWKNDGNLRFETLLWGGDEMLFVVPAWKGWEFVADFYAASKCWTFEGEKLTHAGGLVFCHHNAPIGRVKKLAMDLANEIKNRNEANPFVNFFAYEILESFDHIGQNMAKYRAMRMPKSLRETVVEETDLSPLILDGVRINTVSENFKKIKDSVPRRRLYRLAKYLIEGKGQSIIDDEIGELLIELDGDSKEILCKLSPLLNGPEIGDGADVKKLLSEKPIVWIHLNNLWDYLV